jgi:hypothetical protein
MPISTQSDDGSLVAGSLKEALQAHMPALLIGTLGTGKLALVRQFAETNNYKNVTLGIDNASEHEITKMIAATRRRAASSGNSPLVVLFDGMSRDKRGQLLIWRFFEDLAKDRSKKILPVYTLTPDAINSIPLSACVRSWVVYLGPVTNCVKWKNQITGIIGAGVQSKLQEMEF